MKPSIDHEFKSICPPLAPDELALLRQSIANEGLRDPIVTWNGMIVDGHNRFAICQELGVEVRTTEIELNGRDAAKLWILKNQFSRRNLTRIQVGYLRGKYYHQVKTSKPGRKPKGESPVCVGENKQVSDIVGKIFNVARFVIENDARLADAIDSLDTVAREAVLSGKVTGHAAYIRQLAAIPIEDQLEIVEQVQDSGKPGEIAKKLKEWRDDGGVAFSKCPACFAAVAVGKRCEKCLRRKSESESKAKEKARPQSASKQSPPTASDLEVVRLAHAIMQWMDITPKSKANPIHFATLGRLQRELEKWIDDE